MNGRRTAFGFTLIELLMTVAIITILISVGIPMYGQLSRGSAVSGTTSELVAALNETRSRAVSERRRMRLEQVDGTAAVGTWSGGWQLVRDTDDAIVQMVDRRTNSQGISVLTTPPVDEVIFDKEGRATSGAVVIDICNMNNTAGIPGRTLSVTAFGRVSVATKNDCP